MATKSDERKARLIRLTSDGKNKGGGLPLPLLFHAIAADLLDHGGRVTEDLLPAVERELGFKESRITAPDMYPSTGFSGLLQDALITLKEARIAKRVNGHWELTKSAQSSARRGKPMLVMAPWRSGLNDMFITVYQKDQRERLSADAIDKRELQSAYNDLCEGRPMEAKRAGRTKPEMFELHPLVQPEARIAPVQDFERFVKFADGIKENGFKEPIRLHGGKVLDGRHRLAVAAAFRLELSVEDVSDRDPSQALAFYNRHTGPDMGKTLTAAQKTVMVWRSLVGQAKKEAEERELRGVTEDGAGGRGNIKTLASERARVSETGKAYQVAADRSNRLTSRSSLENFARYRVMEAPETLEQIWSGEITTVKAALESAAQELGLELPPPGRTRVRTATEYAGESITAQRRTLEALRAGLLGKGGKDELLARAEAWEAAAREFKELVTEQGGE